MIDENFKGIVVRHDGAIAFMQGVLSRKIDHPAVEKAWGGVWKMTG